jgi:Phospholipase_D-nuclease N-terminal
VRADVPADYRRGREHDGTARSLLYGCLVRILIGAVIALFLILWVRAVIDVFRRSDLTRAAKSGWAIVMLLIPFVGLLLYMLLRPSDAQIAQRSPR